MPIVYGYPTPGTMKKAGEGEGKFKLGGCTIDIEGDFDEKRKLHSG